MKVELYGKRYYTDKSGCLYSDVLHYILGIPSVSLTQMYNMRQMIEERSQKGIIFMKIEDENRKLKNEVNLGLLLNRTPPKDIPFFIVLFLPIIFLK